MIWICGRTRAGKQESQLQIYCQHEGISIFTYVYICKYRYSLMLAINLQLGFLFSCSGSATNPYHRLVSSGFISSFQKMRALNNMFSKFPPSFSFQLDFFPLGRNRNLLILAQDLRDIEKVIFDPQVFCSGQPSGKSSRSPLLRSHQKYRKCNTFFLI